MSMHRTLHPGLTLRDDVLPALALSVSYAAAQLARDATESTCRAAHRGRSIQAFQRPILAVTRTAQKLVLLSYCGSYCTTSEKRPNSISKSFLSLLRRLVVPQHCLRLRA